MSATIYYPRLRFPREYNNLEAYIKKYQINMKLKKVWEGCTEREKEAALNAFDVTKELGSLRKMNTFIDIKFGDWVFQKLQEKGHTDAMGERQLKRYNKLARLFWKNVLFPYQFRCRLRRNMTKLFYDNTRLEELRCRTETLILLSSYMEDKLFKTFCENEEKDDWQFNKYAVSMLKNNGKGWIIHVRSVMDFMESTYQMMRKRKSVKDVKDLENVWWKKYEKVRKVALSRIGLFKSGSSSSSNGSGSSSSSNGSGSSSSRKRKVKATTTGSKRRKVQEKRKKWTEDQLELLKKHKDFTRALNDKVDLKTAAQSIQKSLFPKFGVNRVYTKLQQVIKNKKDKVLHDAIGALMLMGGEHNIE